VAHRIGRQTLAVGVVASFYADVLVFKPSRFRPCVPASTALPLWARLARCTLHPPTARRCCCSENSRVNQFRRLSLAASLGSCRFLVYRPRASFSVYSRPISPLVVYMLAGFLSLSSLTLRWSYYYNPTVSPVAALTTRLAFAWLGSHCTAFAGLVNLYSLTRCSRIR